MQEVQLEIMEIKKGIFTGEIKDDDIQKAKMKLKELEAKLKRLKEHYKEIIKAKKHEDISF